MAYRRSLITRVGLLKERFHPSFSYIAHNDDDKKTQTSGSDMFRPASSNLLQRGYHSSNFNRGAARLSYLFQERSSLPLSPPLAFGSMSHRYSSSAIGEATEKIEYLSDAAEILQDSSIQIAASVSQSPVVSEVAIAAADSYLPVAALQYLIDGVHHLPPGIPWWLAIALTSIMIRGATVPLLVNQLKATTKLTLMRPRLEQIKEELHSTTMDAKAMAEGQRRMQALFKEYGVSPFTPLRGMLIQGPVFISFYLAITNMVEKVPSFKEGGALWFTDLTTPDSLYILPVLTAMSFLLTVECNMQEGLEGNPIASKMKNVFRGVAVLTVPLTMGFPKGIFCYWITSNLFSLVYGLVIKRPDVKKFLNIPEIPKEPKVVADASSLFSSSGPADPRSEESSSSLLSTPSKISDQKISSASVLSQQIQTLEKQVKAKNSRKTSEGEEEKL